MPNALINHARHVLTAPCWTRLMLLVMGAISSGLTLARAEPVDDSAAATKSSRWNILFIFTDDQTHRSVSAYEQAWPWVRTPNIDQLAKNGVRFEHAYCGSWCTPSRAMMMSGRHLHALERPKILRTDDGIAPTWLAALREANYETCFVGKWDLPPSLAGSWDHSVCWNRSLAANKPPIKYYRDPVLEIDEGPPHVVEGYATDLFTRHAVDFVTSEHDRPWFLWLCYGAPHVPSIPPARYSDLYAGVMPTLTDAQDMFGPRDNVPGYQTQRSTVTRQGNRIERGYPRGMLMTDLIKQYAATVRGIDDAVGELVASLHRSGQLDNTLIVFTSDDGMPFGEHGFINKIGPYDACQRVPMIVRGPSGIARGQVCRHPVGALDLIPTFLAVAGARPPYAMHGHDLSAILRNPARDWSHPVMLEFFGFHAGAPTRVGVTPYEIKVNKPSPEGLPWWLSLRHGRYKYIRTLVEHEIEELYDVEADPQERRNLAVEEAYRNRLRDFRTMLEAELRRTGGERLAKNLPAPVEMVQPTLSGKGRGVVISTLGSARATTGVGNKIVTYASKSHVVWQDATNEGYLNRVRSYDHSRREWSRPITLKAGPYTRRTRPVITVDHRGYLHVVMNGHDSSLTYRRSLRPGTVAEWTGEAVIGDGIYPSIVCNSQNTLYVSVQVHDTGNADLFVKQEGGGWKQRRLVQRGGEFAGTFAACLTGLAVGPDDSLHFVCNLQRGKAGVPGLHQAVCYLRSRDSGQTWEKSDGTPVPLPARPEQMDILAEGNPPPHELRRGMRTEFAELVANGNIVVDSKGTPYVLYVSHLENPGQLILATPGAKGEWSRRTIHVAERKYPEMRPIGISFPLTIAADDTLYALVELVPLGAGWRDGKPLRRTVLRSDPVKRLVLLSSADRGRTFTATSVLDPGNMFHMANIERPTGANSIPAGRVPPWVYFDGRCDYPSKTEIRNNNVYWIGR